jgi:MtN3 and saliva related transmembrane protein
MIIDIIGYIAGILGLIALIPQIVKSFETKSTGDLSLSMYLIYTISVILWLVYGYLINSMPMIL